MFLDRVAKESAISDLPPFCSCDRLTGITFLLSKEQSTGVCLVKKKEH